MKTARCRFRPHAKKIALIGPFAEDAEELVGPWSSRAHASDIVSLADAVRAKIPSDFQLTVARGCAIIEPGGGISAAPSRRSAKINEPSDRRE